MHPAFREIHQKKLAIMRSYNISRLKITMDYSETVKVVHQLEDLMSVEGRVLLYFICILNKIIQCLPLWWR